MFVKLSSANSKIAYLLLWGYHIDGLKFAKLYLVDVKLPTAVEKLPTAVTNLDFFIAHESCFVVFQSCLLRYQSCLLNYFVETYTNVI